MPRTARHFIDGLPYHLLNRGNRRQRLFFQPGDYEAFLTALADTLVKVPLAFLAFIIMPNHFHFVVRPNLGCEISAFMKQFMNAHIRRYHRHHELWGTGHLYQGRYKAFPIQCDHHLLTVLRYVEANALRARLVSKAEAWEWSSLSRHTSRDGYELLRPSPITRPSNWLDVVNENLPIELESAVRASAQRQVAFGDSDWMRTINVKTDPQRYVGAVSVPFDCPL